MRLELKKNNLRRSIVGGFVTIFMMMIFVIMVNYDEAFHSYQEAFELTNAASFIFIIFAAVLISRFVIDEYKSKSVTVLFMYPLNRKKILFAKLAIVFLYTFIFSILSRVIIFSGFYIYNQFARFVTEDLTTAMLLQQGIGMLTSTAMTACIGLIPLFFGMRKYSVPATVLSGVILMGILNAGSGTDFNLGSIIFVPAAAAVIGISIAYFSIRKVEVEDIL